MNHLEHGPFLAKVRQCLETGQSLHDCEEIVRDAKQVKQLQLHHIPITTAMMQEIVLLFPQLTSLRLDSCKLNEESCRLVCTLSLTQLDLSNNPELVGSFVPHLPNTLNNLVISGNRGIPIQQINAIWVRFRGKNFTLTH